MADKGLTIKQEKYAQGLFAGLSQREAYKQAYDCSNTADKTVDENACRLAADSKVIARIEELENELKLRNMVTVERVIAEYAKIGFFDPRKLFNDNGSPKEITELDDDTAASLAGLDVQEVYEGYGDDRKFIGYTKKYKLADKKSALDSIGKYLGMFTDNLKLSGGTTNINIELSPEDYAAVMKADMTSPEGIELLKRIKEKYPGITDKV
jgi:phage terminase small subunit